MDNWSKDHLDRMRVGGNRKCQRYLECHNLPIETDIPIKYSSEPAEKYKEVIKDRVEKRRQKALLDGSNKSNMTDESMGSFASDDHSSANNNNNNNNHKRSSENSGGGSGVIMEDDSGGEEEQHQQSSTLDSWFNMSTKRRAPSLRGSSAHGIGGGSYHSAAARMNYRRSHSSNSTPTIVYMGKSFSADGSDAPHLAEHVQKGKARMRSQSDIKLLAELSLQQEEIAKANLSTSHWRHSAPLNFWTSDKKVEPFDADSYYGGGGGRRNYSFAHQPRGGSNNSDDARRRARQQESMRQKLAYSDADVLKIAQDDQEFARLKAGLKHKGAVTNEVLKQKLYAFVAKSKLRVASNNSNGENNNNNRSNSPKNSSADDDILGGPRSKTIHTSTAKRL